VLLALDMAFEFAKELLDVRHLDTGEGREGEGALQGWMMWSSGCGGGGGCKCRGRFAVA